MIKIFLGLFIFSQIIGAANRPYNDVVNELTPKECKSKKENLFLSKEEIKKIEKRSESKIYGGLALRYVVDCPKGKIFHYVDSHIVRTLNETVVISIQNGKVISFNVASFGEPPEYKAPAKWYQQFEGKGGEEVLKARKNIDALSGATLTVNSSISAVNKILALHQHLESKKKNKSKNKITQK